LKRNHHFSDHPRESGSLDISYQLSKGSYASFRIPNPSHHHLQPQPPGLSASPQPLSLKFSNLPQSPSHPSGLTASPQLPSLQPSHLFQPQTQPLGLFPQPPPTSLHRQPLRDPSQQDPHLEAAVLPSRPTPIPAVSVHSEALVRPPNGLLTDQLRQVINSVPISHSQRPRLISANLGLNLFVRNPDPGPVFHPIPPPEAAAATAHGKHHPHQTSFESPPVQEQGDTGVAVQAEQLLLAQLAPHPEGHGVQPAVSGYTAAVSPPPAPPQVTALPFTQPVTLHNYRRPPLGSFVSFGAGHIQFSHPSPPPPLLPSSPTLLVSVVPTPAPAAPHLVNLDPLFIPSSQQQSAPPSPAPADAAPASYDPFRFNGQQLPPPDAVPSNSGALQHGPSPSPPPPLPPPSRPPLLITVPFDAQTVPASFQPPPPPGLLDYDDFPTFEAVPPGLIATLRGQR
jgi:hypothetical protein